MNSNILADDERLLDALKKGVSFELRERKSAEMIHSPRMINFFPIAIGGEIPRAVIISDELLSEDTKEHILRFCQAVAPELEILRLREELNRLKILESAIQKFNDKVKDINTDDFWGSLMHICAELMRAERGSLFIFDEKSNSLSAKAAIGGGADFVKEELKCLGERVAHKVLQNGKPMIVEDLLKIGIPATDIEWKYKTNSFISYPIMIGQRKIGVLNFSDRIGGECFNKLDLEILSAIMPQLSSLTESAMLRQIANEFEQLSITDALTGLLNRLYLDERLPEEVSRSNREGFPMSFMMIDVDKFKSYNDEFGHTEADKALKKVAHCLRSTLRGADVAVRFGGDEFSILLPQTALDEAAGIAERIREKVATTKFPNRQVTVSIGVATCSNLVCTAHEIIELADSALYEAKRRGKNNVQIYEHFYAQVIENA
jgi:diguanylate cyclase (GGDEF)-like protein